MITSKKNTNSERKNTKAVRTKILTAEGWKRMMLKETKPTPKKTKK